jgi:hypothetical protein
MSILVTDEFENLKLYHYDSCDLNSPSELQSTRGIIKHNSAIVCKTNGFIPEITTEDSENIKKFIETNSKDGTFYEAQEGSIVRLWYYSEDPDVKKHKWFLSTHKRINAFSSKWGSSTTYGETFITFISKLNIKAKNVSSWADVESDEDENQLDSKNVVDSVDETNLKNKKTVELNSKNKTIFDSFCTQCDKNCIYNFLIRNTNNNRVVVKGYTEPEIYCLGTYNKTKNFKYEPVKKNFLIPSLPSYTFSTIEKAINDINKFDVFKVPGLLLITSSGNMVKLVNPRYDHLFKLRGNVPNILVRYLELRSTESDKIELYYLYDEKIDEFKEMETILSDIAKNIFRKYLSRYVYKKVSILPPVQYKIMNKLHNLYKDKIITKMTLNDVIKTIDTTSASELYNLIKNYKYNKLQYGNGNFVSEELRQKIYTN